MIFLTSFKKSLDVPHMDRWSAAVYQPKAFSYPKAECFDIRDRTGKWIRPREFILEKNPLIVYRRTLLDMYEKRDKKIKKWMGKYWSIGPPHAALCCWCPYERAAQRQIKEWGSYVCHLSIVGEYLNSIGGKVWYDSDRLNMAVLTQKFK